MPSGLFHDDSDGLVRLTRCHLLIIAGDGLAKVVVGAFDLDGDVPDEEGSRLV